MTSEYLSRTSELSFPLEFADGKTITTVGEAADVLAEISDQQRQQNHWQIAIRMLDHALREQAYLRTATMSLQTALAMSGELRQING